MEPLCFRPFEQGGETTALKLVTGTYRAPYSVKNKGLEFRIPTNLAEQDTILLPLNCGVYRKDLPTSCVYAIPLSHDADTGDWIRISAYEYEARFEREKEVFSTKPQGLYIVDQTELWSREFLKESGSEVIYLRL